MALAQLRNLLESRGQLCKLAAPAQTLDRAQLVMRGTTGAHEVRVIGICEAICARARRGHDGALLEEQDGLIGTCQREHVGDRLQALRVRDRVTTAIQDSELHVLLGRQASQERSTLRLGRTDLQMGRARAGQRAAAEQRPAQVSAAAARARDDSPRWMGKRRQSRTEDTGLVKNLQRVFVPGDVQLVTGTAFEGAAGVRSDLAADAERPEQAERSARDR